MKSKIGSTECKNAAIVFTAIVVAVSCSLSVGIALLFRLERSQVIGAAIIGVGLGITWTISAIVDEYEARKGDGSDA